MKRILIRLSALAAVVTLGVLAVVQAQRGLRPSGDQKQTADQGKEDSLAKALAEATDKSASVPDPEDRYASRTPAGDRPPAADPFASWRPGAHNRTDAARTTAGPEPQPLDEATTDANSRGANVAKAAGEDFPDAADALPSRAAAGVDGQSDPLDKRVVAAGYETQTNGRNAAAARARAVQSTKAVPGEPTLAPPREEAADRYGRTRAGAASGTTDGGNPGEPMLTRSAGRDPLAQPANRAAAREPAPLNMPLDATARQLEVPGRVGDERDAGAGNFTPPAGAQRSLQQDSLTEGSGRPGGKQLEGTQSPSLSIEKTAPAEVQVDKPAVFQIVVRNTGQTPAVAVEVRDQVPKGTRLVSTTPRAAQTPQGELLWSLGTIKPGEETSLQMELVPLAEGEIGSVATVHFAAESSVRTHATKPQLTLEVKVQPEVMIGDEITLSIKMSNPGSGAASGVLLQEAVPDSLEHVAGPELEYEVGEIKPGETRQLELTMKAVKAGKFTNTLYARGEGAAQAECKTEMEVIAPALDLALEGPKRRFLDRQATYTVTVSNPGTAAAKQVQLLTRLPPGLKFVEANNAGQYDAQARSVHWLLDELPANEMGSVTLTVLPVEAGEQPLQVESTADRGLSAKREQMVVVEGVSAILFTVADVADPVEVDGETTYEIRVVNQGTKAATNLQLVTILPDEMKPTGGEGPTRHVVDGQRVLFDPLPQLAPKADTTFKVKAQALRAGDVRVRVQLLTDGMRAPVTKEESTQVYADE